MQNNRNTFIFELFYATLYNSRYYLTAHTCNNKGIGLVVFYPIKPVTKSQINIVYFFFLRLNIRLLNSMRFITIKKPTSIINVRYGFVGAMFASNINGKPNTMAGKF